MTLDQIAVELQYGKDGAPLSSRTDKEKTQRRQLRQLCEAWRLLPADLAAVPHATLARMMGVAKYDASVIAVGVAEFVRESTLQA